MRLPPRAAAHRGETDELIGVIAHEVCHHVLHRMQRLGIKVILIRLAEAQVVLNDFDAAAQVRAVGHANIRRADEAVVEFEGLHVELLIILFSHASPV